MAALSAPLHVNSTDQGTFEPRKAALSPFPIYILAAAAIPAGCRVEFNICDLKALEFLTFLLRKAIPCSLSDVLNNTSTIKFPET